MLFYPRPCSAISSRYMYEIEVQDMSYEKAFEFEANEEFVELCFPDGTVVHIDRESVEADLLQHPRDQFLLDTLAFNEPLRYMQLVLWGDLQNWLADN